MQIDYQAFLFFPLIELFTQVAGTALALEHALMMVLLLTGLLSIPGEHRRYVPWVVLAGAALSLFTPRHSLTSAWSAIAAFALPPLLWQVGMRLAMVRPSFTWQSGLGWLLVVVLIALAVVAGGGVRLASAVLLGVLAASLIWQMRDWASGHTDLGAFGQLALALLLAEVDVAEQPVGPLLGDLFSGAGVGLLIGFLGVSVAFRLDDQEARNFFCLFLAYPAYLTGMLIGGSGVVAAAMTGLTVTIYGYSVGLWATSDALPAPLNRRAIFLLLAGGWLLLGWEAHVPLALDHVASIALGLVAVAVGLLMGGWLAPQVLAVDQTWLQVLQNQMKVFLLLAGTLLLWPRQAILDPWALAIALLAALLALALLRTLIFPVFDIAGLPLRLPSAGEEEPGEGAGPALP